MLNRYTSVQLLRIHAMASLLLIATIPLPLKTSAQSSSFVGDTLIPPYLFDLRADGSLYDFGFDSSSTICFIGGIDEQGTNYAYVVRRDDHVTHVDTLYRSVSPPSTSKFYLFDSEGQEMALGFGFDITNHSFFVFSNDEGQTWDTVEIGDTAYYQGLKIVKPDVWLLKSLSPFEGWRHVTRDTAYWFYHKEWTDSWVQLLDNDSLLLFWADNGCGRGDGSDTGYLQIMRIGEITGKVTPIVPPATSSSLPIGTVCPRLNFIEFDGERLWFKREWGISYPDQTNAYPTELYSYNLWTGIVQFEYFIRHPRRQIRAVLFADHIFLALDSQLVYRHIDDPPTRAFGTVTGVEVGLGNLQVHEGALYGSRASGLIMRISQVSSVPTSDVENSGSFTTEIQGGEIAVFADSGPISNDVRLELFDTQGRRIAESIIASGSRVGRLPAPIAPGVYILRCGGSETSTNLKIIVP